MVLVFSYALEVLLKEGLRSRPGVFGRLRPIHRLIRIPEKSMRRAGIGFDLTGLTILLEACREPLNIRLGNPAVILPIEVQDRSRQLLQRRIGFGT